jgi:hypothetical protein
MKTITLKLNSLSPYSQSRYHGTEKLPKELSDAYEKRTWKEKGHWNKNGNMIIQPMMLANCIKESAKYLSLPIAGKGKSTYTKHFEAGILVTEQIILATTKDTVHENTVFCNADGKKGSGTRVMRSFPTALEWDGTATVYILDDIITQDIFEQVANTAGNLIGLGQFRPRNGGYFGRFKAEILDWQE